MFLTTHPIRRAEFQNRGEQLIVFLGGGIDVDKVNYFDLFMHSELQCLNGWTFLLPMIGMERQFNCETFDYV